MGKIAHVRNLREENSSENLAMYKSRFQFFLRQSNGAK